jgi:hypothetical protein
MKYLIWLMLPALMKKLIWLMLPDEELDLANAP